MRRDDLHSATELRDRLVRAGGAEWVELRALHSWFGGSRLSTARKRKITAALVAARIDVCPPLLKLSGSDNRVGAWRMRGGGYAPGCSPRSVLR